MDIAYKYYVLPLRVFFTKYRKRSSEEDKFISFITLNGIKVMPLLGYYLGYLGDNFHIQINNNLLIRLIVIVLSAVYVFALYRFFMNCIKKKQVTEAQANNRSLFLFGTFLFIEPVLFFIAVLLIYLKFVVHKF